MVLVDVFGRKIAGGVQGRAIPLQPAVIKLKRLSPAQLGAIQRKKLSKPLQVLTSPRTTAVLGATLGALLLAPAATIGLVKAIPRFFKAPKIGLGTALAIPSGIALLKTSPTARAAGKGILKGDPGRLAAELIEKAPDTAKETAKKGGLIGLGIAAAAGLVAGKGLAGKVPKGVVGAVTGAVAAGGGLIGSAVKGKAKKAPTIQPTGILPSPPSITPTTQPLGAVEKPKEVAVTTQPKPVSIKNVFKPSVDISFRKSKKFINQQIIVK